MTYSNGDVYMGNWKSDLQNGHGTFISVHGDIYEGSWKGGEMHGKGKLTCHSGIS